MTKFYMKTTFTGITLNLRTIQPQIKHELLSACFESLELDSNAMTTLIKTCYFIVRCQGLRVTWQFKIQVQLDAVEWYFSIVDQDSYSNKIICRYI